MQKVTIKEQRTWRGHIRVIVFDRDGKVKQIDEFDNLITDAGLNLIRDLLSGAVADGEIKYMAWGDDDTTPSAADTKLGNELGRQQVTKQENGVNAGVLDTTTYLSPLIANGQIEELGWFAGPDATSAKDSGVLVARVLYSKLKTELESIQVVRTDTIGEVV